MTSLTRAQARDLDRRAAAEYGLPGLVLMENAGRGLAEVLVALNPERKRTVILCGPGNNGGDGFVAARHLDNRGWPVELVVPAAPTGDAATMFAAVRCCLTIRDALTPNVWVIDALFGTGLSRPLAPPFSDLVEALNASGRPVLAADVPSGLDADTGEPFGTCVRATHTATFAAPKRGFANPSTAAWTGTVHVVDIGVPRALLAQYRE